MSAAETFGAKVREFRTDFGLSQAQLAEKLTKHGINLHFSAISKIENAERTVTLNEAVALAEVLYISLSGLLQDAPPMASDEKCRRAFDRIVKIATEARP